MSATTCQPKHVFRDSPQWEVTHHKQGSTRDIISTIMYADTLAHTFVIDAGLKKCLVGPTDYDTLHNVWAFVRAHVRYQQDRPGHERVKSPGALFKIGYGDCKSMSVAIAAILRRLGIRYKYRFTAYSPGDYTHVYIVAYPAGGAPVMVDAVHKIFDEEVPYYKKKDYTPQDDVSHATSPVGSGVHGLGTISYDFTPILIGGILLLVGIEIFRQT